MGINYNSPMTTTTKNENGLREFPSIEAAQEFMADSLAKMGEVCADNWRFAWNDDNTEMTAYAAVSNAGTAEPFDEKVVIEGREAWVGCNYGY